MSELTREEILKLIEEHGGPWGLDLSGKDLSGIDLSRIAITAELEKVQKTAPDEIPVWFSEETRGINLQGVDLTKASLQGANLSEANLERADLDEANLERAWLACANFRGASLRYAKLQGATLVGANLQGADLVGANLHKACLGGADLREACVGIANLQDAYLVDANLARVNLIDADNIKGIWLYGATLADTRLTKDQLGGAIGEERGQRYYWAREAYLALKSNFNQLGRYDDASWAYVKERQMGKMCSAPWRARRFYGASQLGDTEESKLPAWYPKVLLFYTRHTGKYLADWLVELVCCYGEGISNVLASMFVLLLGFATLYWVIGGVGSDPASPSTNFWDYLKYSWGVFIGKDFDTARALSDRIELLSSVQTFLRNILTGLLGFVLGNRIRRS